MVDHSRNKSNNETMLNGVGRGPGLISSSGNTPSDVVGRTNSSRPNPSANYASVPTLYSSPSQTKIGGRHSMPPAQSSLDHIGSQIISSGGRAAEMNLRENSGPRSQLSLA